AAVTQVLKADLFGSVSRSTHGGDDVVIRDLTGARWWLKPLARHLARREARALALLAGMPGTPGLIMFDGNRLVRNFVAGQPMQLARPDDASYYREALRLVRRLHRAGVAHNDLAKEPNWL